MSYGQNQNGTDSFSYPCYSNGTSIIMFHSDTSSKEKQFDNYKAYLLGYPSYDTLKIDSTNNKTNISTHGLFIKDDSLFGVEKEVINPFTNATIYIKSALDSTEDSLLQRQGILFTEGNEPILTDSKPAILSLSQEISYTLETQASLCNFYNWEKYIKEYKNKNNYISICFNTDNWNIKSDFSILFYEELLKGKYSVSQELIEITLIRFKERHPTIEYKMASF